MLHVVMCENGIYGYHMRPRLDSTNVIKSDINFGMEQNVCHVFQKSSTCSITYAGPSFIHFQHHFINTPHRPHEVLDDIHQFVLRDHMMYNDHG